MHDVYRPLGAVASLNGFFSSFARLNDSFTC
jgi:hypothetical protein